MKATRPLILAAMAVAFSSGCASVNWSAPVQPPRGLLYTHYRAPLTAEIAGVPTGGKTGTASTLYVRDILVTGQGLAWDDASIEKAAREAGIKTVHYADYEILEVLGIFGEFTVRVHGE